MTRAAFETSLIRIRAMCDVALGDYHALSGASPTPRERALLRRQVIQIENAITDLEMSGSAVYYTKTAQNKLDLPPIPRIDVQNSLLHFSGGKSEGEVRQ